MNEDTLDAREPFTETLDRLACLSRLGIALLADAGSKEGLAQLVARHESMLRAQTLFATSGTADRLRDTLDMEVEAVGSGPKGGDILVASAIVQGRIDVLIFLRSGLEVVPHASDVEALWRVATMKNIVSVSNLATADLVLEAIARARSDPSG